MKTSKLSYFLCVLILIGVIVACVTSSTSRLATATAEDVASSTSEEFTETVEAPKATVELSIDGTVQFLHLEAGKNWHIIVDNGKTLRVEEQPIADVPLDTVAKSDTL
jgi:hypothetical protein